MPDLIETTLRSEQLIEGTYLKVFRDEVRLPDGATAVREWIKHPGGAAVVPLFEDGTTRLVRQYRYVPRRALLEIPAGKADYEGEDPEAVAARELEEEIGWRAGRLVRLGVFHPCIGYSDECIHVFLALDLVKVEQRLDQGEFLEIVTMPFDEAVARARRGDLLDMKTVVALLLAEQPGKGEREQGGEEDEGSFEKNTGDG